MTERRLSATEEAIKYVESLPTRERDIYDSIEEFGYEVEQFLQCIALLIIFSPWLIICVPSMIGEAAWERFVNWRRWRGCKP